MLDHAHSRSTKKINSLMCLIKIPTLRWLHDVLQDLIILKVTAWWEKAQDRESWKAVTRRPKLTKGCRAR
jgi:hypothetical protein